MKDKTLYLTSGVWGSILIISWRNFIFILGSKVNVQRSRQISTRNFAYVNEVT